MPVCLVLISSRTMVVIGLKPSRDISLLKFDRGSAIGIWEVSISKLINLLRCAGCSEASEKMYSIEISQDITGHRHAIITDRLIANKHSVSREDGP